MRKRELVRDYIRAEGDFHKETYIAERTNKAEIRPKNRVRKWRVVGRIFGMKYS